MYCRSVKQQIAERVGYPEKTLNARAILAANLAELMRANPSLNSRKTLGARAGISPRTVGYMMQSGKGNPTLANIEAVAAAFRVPVWQLLADSAGVKRLASIAAILDAPPVPDERLSPAWNANHHSVHEDGRAAPDAYNRLARTPRKD